MLSFGIRKALRKHELIQIDGSPHHWFEDRGESCTLIVFIDDATSELVGLNFSPTETIQSYMDTLSQYLKQHGRQCRAAPTP